VRARPTTRAWRLALCGEGARSTPSAVSRGCGAHSLVGANEQLCPGRSFEPCFLPLFRRAASRCLQISQTGRNGNSQAIWQFCDFFQGLTRTRSPSIQNALLAKNANLSMGVASVAVRLFDKPAPKLLNIQPVANKGHRCMA